MSPLMSRHAVNTGWAVLGWGETWKLGNLIFHQSLITRSHVMGIYLKYASTNIIIYSRRNEID